MSFSVYFSAVNVKVSDVFCILLQFYSKLLDSLAGIVFKVRAAVLYRLSVLCMFLDSCFASLGINSSCLKVLSLHPYFSRLWDVVGWDFIEPDWEA